GMGLYIVFVYERQLIQLRALLLDSQRSRRRMEIQDRIARGAEHRALISGGQKPGAPLRRAGEGTAARILNDDEGGKTMILTAQAVRHPRTNGSKKGDDRTRIPLASGQSVTEGPTLRRVNECQRLHHAA